MESFVERLNETAAVIEKLREIKEFAPSIYEAGNLISLEQLQKVCENAEASYAYLEENAANIDAAVEHQQEIYAQIEEILAQQRKEEGYRKVFMGTL